MQGSLFKDKRFLGFVYVLIGLFLNPSICLIEFQKTYTPQSHNEVRSLPGGRHGDPKQEWSAQSKEIQNSKKNELIMSRLPKKTSQ